MESFDVLRVLSLVVVWGIPAVLVLGVIAFIILAPALTFGGTARRLYESITGRMRRKAQEEPASTIAQILASAGLILDEETVANRAMAAKRFTLQPVSEVDKLLATAGVRVQEEAPARFCWEILHCPTATREACPAYARRDMPRWVAIGLGKGGRVSEVCVNRALLDLKTAS